MFGYNIGFFGKILMFLAIALTCFVLKPAVFGDQSFFVPLTFSILRELRANKRDYLLLSFWAEDQ